MSKSTTKLDLVLSAQRAARAALVLRTNLERREASIAAFRDDKNEAVDFDLWHQCYEDELVRYTTAAAEPAPSARAAALLEQAQKEGA